MVFGIAVTVTGCGPSLQMRAPGPTIVPSRTIVLSPNVTAYHLDVDGAHVDEDKHTKALERTLGAEFERQARTKGALPVPIDKVRACGNDCMTLLSTAFRWGSRSAMEIAKARDGVNRSGRSSVEEWQSDRDFQPLRRAVEADHVLTFYVRDIHYTPGRAWAESMRGPLARAMSNEDSFLRILAVCALNLTSGRMVWCSTRADRMVDQYVDLASLTEARRMVEELLEEF